VPSVKEEKKKRPREDGEFGFFRRTDSDVE